MRKDLCQMTKTMNTFSLPGCALTPLISYLKAIGIFRILSEQYLTTIKCRWDRNLFVIQSSASHEEITQFLLRRYCPTPFVSPWNGGSGFYFQEGKTNERGQDGKKIKTGVRDRPTEATRSMEALETSSGERLSAYRKVIAQVKGYQQNSGRNHAPKDDEKADLFKQLRGLLPDEALVWLDAAFVLSGGEIVPSPLMLSGGNEGNLDFSNTYIQNLLKVFDKDSDCPSLHSESWLRNALFGEPAQLLDDSSSGYFAPFVRGGPNTTTGFSANSCTNPWDFILLMEGIVLFTGNVTKRLLSGGRSETAFPFCVKSSTCGHATGENVESSESKGEVWLPTWEAFTDLKELHYVFSEGRGNTGSKTARYWS